VTTAPKIHANRANARASTGPKIADGRARSARNALRHALSLPVCSNPEFSEQVETLAREIAGPDAKPEIRNLARRVTEAQIDLRRVRHVNGERYRGESLPFEPSMRYADGSQLIAIVEINNLTLFFGQNEAKMLSVFNELTPPLIWDSQTLTPTPACRRPSAALVPDQC